MLIVNCLLGHQESIFHVIFFSFSFLMIPTSVYLLYVGAISCTSFDSDHWFRYQVTIISSNQLLNCLDDKSHFHSKHLFYFILFYFRCEIFFSLCTFVTICHSIGCSSHVAVTFCWVNVILTKMITLRVFHFRWVVTYQAELQGHKYHFYY